MAVVFLEVMKFSSLLCASLLFVSCASWRAEGETDFNDVGKVMTGMLKNKHFASIKFDAAMGDRRGFDMLKNMLKVLSLILRATGL